MKFSDYVDRLCFTVADYKLKYGCLYGLLLDLQPTKDRWLAGPYYRKALEMLGVEGDKLMFQNIQDPGVHADVMRLFTNRLLSKVHA